MSRDGRHARTVIVTGASAGAGRAIALRFASAGDRVGLVARDETALKEVQRDLLAAGAKSVEWEAADVSDAAAVFTAAERLEQRLGAIDVWINDAMETVFSTVANIEPAEFRRVTEVTYLGFVYGTMAALKSMRPRGQGRIIQIGSALAYRGIPLQSAYCGAKYAMRGFTDSLRAELLHENSGITISIVELPAVNTPQFDWARAHLRFTPRPMGQPVEPEVVADAVFRIVERSSREYWLGWQAILTILGNTIAPAYLDRYLAHKAVEGQQTDVPLLKSRQDNLDHPLTAAHRVRGSFSAGASHYAPLVAGEVARTVCVALGAAVFFAAGAALGAKVTSRFRAEPSAIRLSPWSRRAGYGSSGRAIRRRR